MQTPSWYRSLPHMALCLLVFTIPFPYIASTIAVVLLIITWLIQLNYKETLKNIFKRKALWAWMAFFILHVISYTYSDNKAQSFFDIQSKMSMFILPIIIGAGMKLGRRQTEQVFLSFVLGITAISLYSFGQASISYIQDADLNHFFYHPLVKGLNANAVYQSWYTILSISLLIFFPWKSTFIKPKRILRLAIIILQIIFFICLSSRTLILLFFLLLIPVYLRSAINKISKPHMILITMYASILTAIVVFTDNPIRNRYESVATTDLSLSFQKDYTTVVESDFSNLTLRVFLWRMGLENISEHNLWLTGAGNGDAQDLQNERMADYGLRNMRTPGPFGYSPYHNANMHNMFLQSLLMIGIGGLICMILITLSPFLHIRKTNYTPVFLIFHVASFFFLMQEAALQTQAGIIYYTTFSMIFWNKVYEKYIN